MNMRRRVVGRWRFTFALLLVVVPAFSIGLAQAPGTFNEHEVKQQSNVQDKGDIWVLDIRFKDPRLITVDVPGRGRKVCWYLWYQLINNTGQARTPTLDFELVTLDKSAVYHDEILPKVQEAIQKMEDPTGHSDIKNSVTIREPIPPSKKDAAPKAVTGVAIWDDTSKEQGLRNTTRFSIFVAGLSNGWSVDDNNVVRRKTLQLNFRRLGDRYSQDSRDIRYVPPAEWIYRAATFQKEAEKVKNQPMKEGAVPPPPPDLFVPLRKAAVR
jgi:hypothetical protein